MHSLQMLLEQAISWHLDAEGMKAIAEEVGLLMTAYVHHYRGDVFTVLGAEQEYRGQFGNVELRATVDMVIKTPEGAAIVEHKSTSEIPPAAWRAVDPQTALQAMLMAKEGLIVDGVMFNYLDTTAKVPRITSKDVFHGSTGITTSAHFDWAAKDIQHPAPGYVDDMRTQLVDDERFFQRFYAKRESALLIQTMRDIAGIADAISRAMIAGHFPRSYSVFNCKRGCPYFNLCTTEYVKGGKSEVLRETEYAHDTGYREGNVE